MNTFLGIYGFLQIVTILWWFYDMLITKPKFNNGRNRFAKNWNEGGKFTLISFSFISFIASVAILIIFTFFKLIDLILNLP